MNFTTIATNVILMLVLLLACNEDPKKVSTTPVVEEQPTYVDSQGKSLDHKTAEQEAEEEEIGPGQLDVSNVDYSGNGIHGRALTSTADYHQRVEALKKSVGDSATGVVQIIACVDERGVVMLARMDEKATTVLDPKLQRSFGKIVVDQKFQQGGASKRECGVLKLNL